MSVSIPIATERPYTVRVGRGILAEVAAATAGASVRFVLSDDEVVRHQRGALRGLERAPTLAVAPGEGAKSFAVLERVLEALAAAGLDRRSCVIALGGGVVGDLAGLAAALYMRGIDVVQCPTTLLAQVDASVGGKTAVNLSAGKNLAGCFHQPRAVFADVDALATLPALELRAGLGEVVKSALIAGEYFVSFLEEHAPRLVAPGDPEVLEHVVAACVRTKGAIVAADEREGGRRKALNLGHTFAHGIEHAAGFGRVPHGIAVATGLSLALRAARELRLLVDAELPARVERLLAALALPTTLAALRAEFDTPLCVDDVLAGMRNDKKGRAGQAALVLVLAPGSVEVDVPAGRELLAAVLRGAG